MSDKHPLIDVVMDLFDGVLLDDDDIRFDRSRLEWACDCPAFKYRRRHRIKYCKHILEIQERNLKRRNNGLAKQRS